MTEIVSGNAELDGKDTRGWIVGAFMPEGIRHTDRLEIKWGVHPSGETRAEWTSDTEANTISILVSGDFTLTFREGEKRLLQPGDYVMWGEGVEHTWQANEDSTVVTVRWHKA